MKTLGSFLAVAVGTGIAVAAISQSGAQSTETIRQYQFAVSGDGYELVMREVPRPAVGPGEVLVRVHATSLNRRDWYILNESIGDRGLDYTDNIPLSDGAGEVIAVGERVTEFQVGDRVVSTFFTDWVDGKRNAAVRPSARGAGPGTGGMLSEMIVTTPRADFEAMNAFMEEHRIRPVIDRVFSFEQAQEAYDLMGNGSFMGKIVIAL